jgi:hypothetical protein
MVILFPISAFADSRLENCLLYKEEISSLLESEGVSSDYFYLAVCESGCRVKTSSKGARGFWQLMPSTYRTYMPDGCSSKDIDDIRCNTVAAARYIKHLQARFKHIALLVKAYNRGGTNFQKYGTTKEADALSRCVLKYISSD